MRQAAGRGQGVLVFCGSKYECESTARTLVAAKVCAGGLAAGSGSSTGGGSGGGGYGGGGGGVGGVLYELEAACPDGATTGDSNPYP